MTFPRLHCRGLFFPWFPHFTPKRPKRCIRWGLPYFLVMGFHPLVFDDFGVPLPHFLLTFRVLLSQGFRLLKTPSVAVGVPRTIWTLQSLPFFVFAVKFRMVRRPRVPTIRVNNRIARLKRRLIQRRVSAIIPRYAIHAPLIHGASIARGKNDMRNQMNMVIFPRLLFTKLFTNPCQKRCFEWMFMQK